MQNLTNNTDVSIIIVNYKSWEHLRNCLLSIHNLKNLSIGIETIVIDNQSNDGKLENFTKEFTEVNFISNTGNNGFANGCNLGALKGRGDYFLFLNPDTIINSKVVEALFNFSKLNRNVGITSCLQKKTTGGYEKKYRSFLTLSTLFGLTRAIQKQFSSRNLISENEILYTDWVSGSLVYISKEWFQQIDGWNEDYWMYYEDMDLSKKVHQSNGKVALLESVEIIHNHGGASRLNIKTSALTKTEVLISKHVFIENHLKGFERFLAHFFLIIHNIIIRIILGFIGIVLFFIPKMRLNVYLLLKMMKYYFNRLLKGNWLSSNSMNQNK